MKNRYVIHDVIKKIKDGNELEEIITFCENDIFLNGPVNISTLEILSIIKELNPSFFLQYEKRIIRLMGLFFKNNNSEISDLKELVIQEYGDAICEQRKNRKFTPMQNEILFKIEKCDNYSFSSPTSTGKSYIFRYLIENAKKDIVIVVPSRALINEFYINVSSYITDKETLVMTFVDDINKAHTKRHIFILTPERARDIFKYKNVFDFEYFLFDEAQLTNEHDERGIYYDGIVRRLKVAYPKTKFIFAHPFIDNPEAQFIKNGFTKETNNEYDSFKYRNTGQLFIAEDNNKFYIFGTDKSLMGEHRVDISYDPIEKVLSQKKGCVLVYTAKSRIIKKEIFTKFNKYIDKYCLKEIPDDMMNIISLIEPLIKNKKDIYSSFIEYLKKGIVFHHGSMPLEVRILLEEFIKKGYCKICFATSTLAQGINMPFDLIYIDRFEKKDKLLLRNLIGRAGRSTNNDVFDYGIVVLKDNNKSEIRKIIKVPEKIDQLSMLDTNELSQEYVEYRDAIKNNDFSDEFNLPNKVIENIERENKVFEEVEKLKMYFIYEKKKEIYKCLSNIFKYIVTPNRKFSIYEDRILEEANKLLFYRYSGYKLTDIASFIYSHKKITCQNYNHSFILKYSPIPNSKIESHIPLFNNNEDLDYDTILYNTYDFYDKLIDLKLMDVYYVTLMKYFIKTGDEFYKEIAIKMKYGTSNPRQIMMMRYGYSSDDFDWLSEVIVKIDEEEILFNNNVINLDDYKKNKIKKYLF